MEIERRYVPMVEAPEAVVLEERGAMQPKIRGISPPFNSPSLDLGGFREVFAPTAFDRILDRHPNDPRGGVDVVGLFNHDDNQVLSRTTSGTLRLTKTDKGLAYEMDPPETTLARDLMTLIRRGDIYGSSFAFSVSPEGESWSQDDKGNTTRTVTSVANLYDVSVVTRAAYPSSSVALRSLEAWRSANLTSNEQQQIAERAADLAADRRRRLADAAGAAAVLRLKANA